MSQAYSQVVNNMSLPSGFDLLEEGTEDTRAQYLVIFTSFICFPWEFFPFFPPNLIRKVYWFFVIMKAFQPEFVVE